MRLFRLGGLALWLAVVLALLMAAFPLHAQEKSALARLEIKHSLLKPEGRDRGRPRPLDLTLAITQPVPWRAYLHRHRALSWISANLTLLASNPTR